MRQTTVGIATRWLALQHPTNRCWTPSDATVKVTGGHVCLQYICHHQAHYIPMAQLVLCLGTWVFVGEYSPQMLQNVRHSGVRYLCGNCVITTSWLLLCLVGTVDVNQVCNKDLSQTTMYMLA